MSFDLDAEKKAKTSSDQIQRKASVERARHAPREKPGHASRRRPKNPVHGRKPASENRNEVEDRPRPPVLRRREALEVLVDEVELQEVGMAKGHRDVPGNREREKEQKRAPREDAPERAPPARGEGPQDDRASRQDDADETLQEDRRRARGVEGVERAAGAPRLSRRIALRERREGERRGRERGREHRVDQRDPRERDEQNRRREDQAGEESCSRPPAPPREGDREEDHGHSRELPREAHRELGRAEERHRRGDRPVVERRLLEVEDAVQTRGHEVVRGEHLARNLAVAAFVRLEERDLPGLENEQQDREKQEREERPVDALRPDHRALTETAPANAQRRSGR